MYKVLARKYRPTGFSELLGQDFARSSIASSIISGRIPHSFLLSGLHGVGKTTTARIIAKILSCTDAKTAEGKSIEPCGKCQNCLSFEKGSHPDILELDAASKTGVDDIKAVLSSGEFKPMLGKYKIFIIDEVHMLSRSSFNALLKTLEEPPAHVIFILATTELRKIPVTVISRCQKYELKPIPAAEITKIISNIAQKEQIQIEKDALDAIIKVARGSARDAITLLDQAVNLAGGQDSKITGDTISSIVGSSDTRDIISLCKSILTDDAAAALGSLQKMHGAGAKPKHMLSAVMGFLSYLCKQIEIEDHQDDAYAPFAHEISDILKVASFASISACWQIFSKNRTILASSLDDFLADFEMIVLNAIYAARITAGSKQGLTASVAPPRQFSSKSA